MLKQLSHPGVPWFVDFKWNPLTSSSCTRQQHIYSSFWFLSLIPPQSFRCAILHWPLQPTFLLILVVLFNIFRLLQSLPPNFLIDWILSFTHFHKKRSAKWYFSSFCILKWSCVIFVLKEQFARRYGTSRKLSFLETLCRCCISYSAILYKILKLAWFFFPLIKLAWFFTCLPERFVHPLRTVAFLGCVSLIILGLPLSLFHFSKFLISILCESTLFSWHLFTLLLLVAVIS